MRNGLKGTACQGYRNSADISHRIKPTSLCIKLPPCDCLQVDSREDEISDVICNDDGNISFSYKFQLTSLFDQDVFHSILVPLGDEIIDPNLFDIFAENGNAPVQKGQSIYLTAEIFGAQPSEPVDFLIIIHNEDFSECCDRVHQIEADVNCDGEVNLLDVGPFVDLLTG